MVENEKSIKIFCLFFSFKNYTNNTVDTCFKIIFTTKLPIYEYLETKLRILACTTYICHKSLSRI